MADKNLARSGPADLGLLSDDDPLAELARIVGYEPRNVPTAARPVPPEPLQEPAFDLESELLREFVRYDAPSLDPAQDVEPQYPAVAVEPEPAAVVGAPSSTDAGPAAPDYVPVDAADVLDSADATSAFAASPMEALAHGDDHGAGAADWRTVPAAADLHSPEGLAAEPASSHPAVADRAEERPEPVFLGMQPVAFAEPAHLAETPAANKPSDFDLDLDLDLDRELELSLGDAFTATDETSGADAASVPYEPQPSVSADRSPYEAAAAGLVIADTGAAHSGVLQPSLVEPLPVTEPVLLDPAGIAAPPVYAEPVPVAPALGEGAHFEATQLPAEVDTVEFVPDWVEAPRSEAPLAAAEQALPTAVAPEPAAAAFDPEAAYAIAPAAPAADGYHFDELLAEVERFPVPEPRAPLAAPVVALATPPVAAAAAPLAEPPRPRPGSLEGFSSIKFGRATPVAVDRRPANAPVLAPAAAPAVIAPVEEPQVSARIEPQVSARIEPQAAPAATQIEPVADAAATDFDAAFGDFQLDLSDIELDLSDLALADEPKRVAAPVVAALVAKPSQVIAPAPVRVAPEPVLDARDARPQSAWPAAAAPARAEPVRDMPAPQPAMSAPQPADPAPQRDEPGFDLPFDPAMIAETDTGVAPAPELDVPQIPVIEKEKPVQAPEYDIDIDSEMAQLFATPAPLADNERGLERAAAVAEHQAPAVADDFDKALEEDLRRSFSQSERHAIPLDAQQSQDHYVGDGYDEPARRGRGLMIAAAAAAVVVLGGAGTYAFLGNGAAGGSGEPRVILADREPIKVVPEEKGGKTVPNQDKAVYDRVSGRMNMTPQQDQLVTSTEEPVDVVQRTLTPESLPFDGPEDETEVMDLAGAPADDERLLPGVDDEVRAPTASEEATGPLVSPRKVRTMIVKPDGTLVAREEPAPEPQSALAMPQDAAPAANTANVAPVSSGADTGLRAEQADDSPRALEEVANAAVAESTPATSASADVGVGQAVAGAPVPVMRPTDQPVDVVGTVTERGRVTDTRPTETAALAGEASPPAEQAQAPAANPGGYVIQIASLPSEAEAQKSYASLSAKFSGVIGGRGVDIQRADIPNKGTYYRVRIPAGSREEANALCGRYKTAGGTCLVTR
ncbi:SPOR domain-containing protein [Mycoplana dimorpha]|uniref:Sporulation related protein n=1 Tax=Mycoplana dimorpha TaxID=28320 RepID=A0A2T5B8M9_MYCDI|nr:SPOR domain-containing protein [Mycoplana dimorpha]PTM95253.1 sporulation related protein [Mycoplana dimorpha]